MPKQKIKPVKPLRGTVKHGRATKQGMVTKSKPLIVQIHEEEEMRGVRTKPRKKNRNKKVDIEEDERLSPEATQKLLKLAQAQQEEEAGRIGTNALNAMLAESLPNSAAGSEVDMDEEVPDVEVDDDGFIKAENLSAEDERALSMFLPKRGDELNKGQTLGDVILQKIQEADARKAKGELVQQDAGLSPKVVQVYRDIGKWLKTYKSGKVPKAFKILPQLVNWEEVLQLTDPLNWSPNAMYEAVNLFASNMNPKMAQRFYNLVLLPAVRQNIVEHHKLNYHYYRALHKAMFKPAAFFKGVLFPLAGEACTLREASLMSSVLAKASIPPLHVAAALVRLCEMSPWYGTTSIFIASLVNKKYALPVRVIESLVAHFGCFYKEETSLPVVWHRGLLLFVQRYKFDLNDDQRRRIRDLLKVHWHEGIGSEIRRELNAPKPGEMPSSSTMDVDMR